MIVHFSTPFDNDAITWREKLCARCTEKVVCKRKDDRKGWGLSWRGFHFGGMFERHPSWITFPLFIVTSSEKNIAVAVPTYIRICNRECRNRNHVADHPLAGYDKSWFLFPFFRNTLRYARCVLIHALRKMRQTVENNTIFRAFSNSFQFYANVRNISL